MKKSRHSKMDPSFFTDIRVGDETINPLPSESEQSSTPEEEFYKKGKDSEIRWVNDDTLVLAGDKGESDIHIDLGGAKNIVKKLRDNYLEVKIKDLNGETKKKFTELHELLEVLRETSAYEHLHNMIIKEFKCKKNKSYQIGTVGAYFCGCHSENKFPGNKSCSLNCLLGMHPEGCNGYYPCEYTCLIYNGDETFSILHKSENHKQAYVFVNHNFLFVGFTPIEVKRLKTLGIDQVKIVQHSEGLSYQEVSSDFIKVDDLRVVMSVNKGINYTQPKSYAGYLLIIVIIVIIIALIFGGWWYYKRGGKFELFRY